MAPKAVAAADVSSHTLLDDAQALVGGTLLAALGALLVAMNLPSYLLAVRKKGLAFTLKTFCAVLLLSGWTELMPRWLRIQDISPLYAAIAGGVLTGVGLLVLFRHNASLGGINILAPWCQERFGWPTGWTQLAFDAAVLIAAIVAIGPWHTAISLVGAAALNAALALNHKPGRYVAAE